MQTELLLYLCLLVASESDHFNTLFLLNEFFPEGINMTFQHHMFVRFQVVFVIGTAWTEIQQAVAKREIKQALP